MRLIHHIQRTRDAFRLCMSLFFSGPLYPGICLAAGAHEFHSLPSAPAARVRRACVTLAPAPDTAFGSQENVLANV